MARKKTTPKQSPSLTAKPGTLLFLVEPYNEWQRVKGFSPMTIERGIGHLRRFILFCEERGLERPEEVTRNVMERYQRHLYHFRTRLGKDLSIQTQLSGLLSVRGFFRYLSKARHVLYNPAAELDLPRVGKRLPRHVLTAEEAETVLSQPDVDAFFGIRDRAILETLYSTGIRRQEAVKLKVYDIDLVNRTVFVYQGKGRKDRMIPIGERAGLWLSKYLHEVRPRLVVEPDPGYVFLTHRGEFLAPDYLTQLVREYVDASGIGKKGSCHVFRHTMATLMLEGGADVRYVQAMLGHSQLSTTEIYTHVSIRKLKEVHEQSHPAKAHREEKALPL
jgi:integrase/recombinase XerD